MKSSYDPKSFFEYLKYYPSDYTPTCPQQKSVSVYVRGSAKQMQTMLEPFPFELNGDVMCFYVADCRNHSHFTFFDGGLLLPVRFDEVTGSTCYYEWEDLQETVASGREKWGYPKQLAKMNLEKSERGAVANVDDYEDRKLSIAVEFDQSVDQSRWASFQAFPHLQVKAISELYGPSFSIFDVISRSTKKDFVLHENIIGRGKIEISSSMTVRGEPLQILEILGAEYTVGDYNSTTNAKPIVLKSYA